MDEPRDRVLEELGELGRADAGVLDDFAVGRGSGNEVRVAEVLRVES